MCYGSPCEVFATVKEIDYFHSFCVCVCVCVCVCLCVCVCVCVEFKQYRNAYYVNNLLATTWKFLSTCQVTEWTRTDLIRLSAFHFTQEHISECINKDTWLSVACQWVMQLSGHKIFVLDAVNSMVKCLSLFSYLSHMRSS